MAAPVANAAAGAKAAGSAAAARPSQGPAKKQKLDKGQKSIKQFSFKPPKQ